MQIVTLPDAQSRSLASSYALIVSPYQDYAKSLRQLYRLFSTIPDDIQTGIFAFTNDPASSGALLVDNLPIDLDLPPTPLDGRTPQAKGTFYSECSLLGLAQSIGLPVGYKSEKDGNPIHHVVPVPGGEDTQSNEGSRVFLAFHNDSMFDDSMIFNSHNPDFLLLLCVRADPDGEAKTYYADARRLWAELDQETRQVLRDTRFRMAAPSNYTRFLSGKASGKKVWSPPVPIFSGPVQYPEICLAANGVMAIDPGAVQALGRLLAACQVVGEDNSIALRPGQALIVNNRKGVHARSHFRASYDGHDRWLMRANIRTNLWSIRDRVTDIPYVFR
jgi:L-asparagine oxygenase